MTTKQKTMRQERISRGVAGSSSGQKSGKSPQSRYALRQYSRPLAAGVRLRCVLAIRLAFEPLLEKGSDSLDAGLETPVEHGLHGSQPGRPAGFLEPAVS
jgi:hypothetical protein